MLHEIGYFLFGKYRDGQPNYIYEVEKLSNGLCAISLKINQDGIAVLIVCFIGHLGFMGIITSLCRVTLICIGISGRNPARLSHCPLNLICGSVRVGQHGLHTFLG
jgi:hypothetical protein